MRAIISHRAQLKKKKQKIEKPNPSISGQNSRKKAMSLLENDALDTRK